MIDERPDRRRGGGTGDTPLNIMKSLGELTGEVRAMHQGVFARIDDIKADIRRLEESQSRQITQVRDDLGRQIEGLEIRTGKRLDGLTTRVVALESEDKRLIEKTALLSATGGGIGGALAAGALELLKRL